MEISYRVKSGTGKTWTQSGLSLYEGAAIPGHRFSSLSVPSKCRFCGVEEVVDVVSDLQEKKNYDYFFDTLYTVCRNVYILLVIPDKIGALVIIPWI